MGLTTTTPNDALKTKGIKHISKAQLCHVQFMAQTVSSYNLDRRAEVRSRGHGSSQGGPHLGSSTAAELVGKRGKRGGEIGAPPSFLDKVSSILDEPKLAERITWNQV